MTQEKKFKVGDKVKLLGTGSSVSSFDNKDGIKCYGSNTNDVVIIKGISPYGGDATEQDPRYYGDGFNVRGYELELVEGVVINKYPIY